MEQPSQPANRKRLSKLRLPRFQSLLFIQNSLNSQTFRYVRQLTRQLQATFDLFGVFTVESEIRQLLGHKSKAGSADWTKTEMIDSAVLEMKAEILPDATQSFEQEIHLAPPDGKWDWGCQPIEVDAKNP